MWPSLDKRSSSVWPGDRENWETPILPCHYRKGHTPKKLLCLSSCSQIRWDRTTLSYASWWCQSCLASTCHPCIASAQHSAKASDSAGAPITTDSCASRYPWNNTGRVRTFTKSKPCSPDNSVRKNCEASRTLESLVEHWAVCALSASHEHFDLSLLFLLLFVCCIYIAFPLGGGGECRIRLALHAGFEVGHLE